MTRLLKILTVLAGLALVAMPAQAYEKGDWIVRGGVGMVSPDDGANPDTDVSVDDGVSAVISGTYMLSPNWGFEILAAFPFSHDLEIDGLGKIGETKHIPPTFSFTYQFAPDAGFRPYAGLGLNYTMFFDEELDQSLLPDFGVSIDDSLGVAAQLGADIKVSETWMLNFEIRYINIEPDVSLTFGGAPLVDTTQDINPMVYSLNLVWVF